MAFLTDSSTNNFPLTAFGDAALNTTTFKYGGGSASFDGNGDYLQFSDNAAFQFGTGDFTIETWLYLVGTNDAQCYITNHYGVDGNFQSKGILVYYDGPAQQLKFYSGSNSGGWDIADGVVIASSPATSTWHHIAVVRNGNTFRTFFNGSAGSTATSNLAVANSVNGYWNIGANNSYCYIDDLRITKGIARYTSNFTPPNAQLLDPSDPYGADVSLLLHMDGLSGSTTFIDSSTNNFELTAFGDAQISTAESKFGGAAGYFDGNSVIESTVGLSELNLEQENFTIEFWAYPTSTAFKYGQLVSWRGPAGAGDAPNHGSLSYDSEDKKVVWYTNTFIVQSSIDSILYDTWTHVSMVRSGSDLKIYINGVNDGTANIGSINYDYIVYGVTVGALRERSGPNNGEAYTGYIDELRITKGIARYTSNFVPQTAPFANPIPPFPTQDLVAFWRLADLTDSSGNGNTLTNNGGVQFIAGKIGNCAQFNGSNALNISTLSPTFDAAQDFTVSFWANPSANVLGTTVGGSGSGTFNIHNNSDGSMSFNNAQAADCSVAGAFTVGTWKHYICIKAGGRIKVYINGSEAYNQPPNVSYSATTNEIGIGRYPGGTLPFQGKIDAVGIWQRELTLEQIAILYNNGNGREL